MSVGRAHAAKMRWMGGGPFICDYRIRGTVDAREDPFAQQRDVCERGATHETKVEVENRLCQEAGGYVREARQSGHEMCWSDPHGGLKADVRQLHVEGGQKSCLQLQSQKSAATPSYANLRKNRVTSEMIIETGQGVRVSRRVAPSKYPHRT
eukprot:scaffold4147_cov412-Prasinococcus_capsulatus_cf.AAC.11